MEGIFETSRQNRNVLGQILRQTPVQQLVEIPAGFNNNIWWNIAHVVVTQQLLLYKLSNLAMAVPEEMVANYRKGTYPKGTPAQDEIGQVAELLKRTNEQAERDYRDGNFREFVEYSTSLGVRLKTIEDALAFNTFHEGLHLGVIMSIKKLL